MLKNMSIARLHRLITSHRVASSRLLAALSKKQRKEIDITFSYVWGYVQTDLPGPSMVDALYISYAIELDIPVVTDDQDMTALAHVFEAKVMPTLELLKIMLDCGHSDIKTIDELVDYWRHIGDRPAKNYFSVPSLEN